MLPYSRRLSRRFDLFGLVGRHLTRIQHIEHLLPPFGRIDRIDGGRQRVNADTAIGIVRPMALEAVRGKDRA